MDACELDCNNFSFIECYFLLLTNKIEQYNYSILSIVVLKDGMLTSKCTSLYFNSISLMMGRQIDNLVNSLLLLSPDKINNLMRYFGKV